MENNNFTDVERKLNDTNENSQLLFVLNILAGLYLWHKDLTEENVRNISSVSVNLEGEKVQFGYLRQQRFQTKIPGNND